jgi:hypothetical protein
MWLTNLPDNATNVYLPPTEPINLNGLLILAIKLYVVTDLTISTNLVTGLLTPTL